MADGGFVTRAVVLPLDVSPSEERLLRSYCGARRFAYNWALGVVQDNLVTRRAERERSVPDAELTPALSWAAYRLTKLWNEVKEQVAPWWWEVSMHAFRSGITDAAAALGNWSSSRSGARKGRRVGFPRFKKRDRTVPSVSFVEINHQLSWLHPDRHHLRLMLTQSTTDRDVSRRRAQLAWLHTTESTRRLYRLVESGRATIQKVTVAFRGGRWQASLLVRYQTLPARRPAAHRRALVGVDVGVRHLATTSVPVAGLTDPDGHIPRPNARDAQLQRLARLDRKLSRCQPKSKNRARLLGRRARLHGQIAHTRALYLHRVTTVLACGFDTVGVEDLNVKGVSHHKGHLGRQFADAALGELRRQLTYKTADAGHHQMVAVGRFYPSSKTCSACWAVKAKLSRRATVFVCDTCGLSCDRDVNAARNIAREARRLLQQQQQQTSDQEVQDVAGLRPET